MKTIKKGLAFFLSAVILATCFSVLPGATVKTAAAGKDTVRAVWISYIDIQYYLQDTSEEKFTRNITNMCKTAKENGLNTVIVQVRPMGDAMYPSSYYPWSYYISSNMKAPAYDPLAIMVEAAHSQGLKIEAWFNPYRLSNNDKTTERFKSTKYYDAYKDDIIEFEGGNGEIWLSLNPASQRARDIITSGIAEVVANYAVDGVHLDDYFYVAGMNHEYDDGESISTAEKKANVNALVRQIYTTVKNINSNCVFGISPAGNLENCRNAGADIDTWLTQTGYVDYLMPQIYWTDMYGSNNTDMFGNRAKAFYNLRTNNVPLYIGLALYRVGEESSTDKGWSAKTTNIVEQYRRARDMGYDGFALFRYQWIDKYEQADDDVVNKVAGTEMSNLKAYLDVLDGTAEKGLVLYQTHVQTYGWEQDVRHDGAISGTTGQSKRLEAIKIFKGEGVENVEGNIEYRVHCQTYGWMDWKKNGELSGTSGESKRLEAIQIRLTGELAEKYDIYYRVHAQTFGWLNWAKNGEMSGTAGYSKRLESIQIVMVEKGGEAPKNDSGNNEAFKQPLISYRTHIQRKGWLSNSTDGQESGTTGSSLRMEGVIIENNTGVSGEINYRVHCQTYGWLPWVSTGQMAGTTGESKRLEAIQIELTGDLKETYEVYYRVHAQQFGWMDWAKNGEMAGTAGFSYRLESLQIMLVPKGGAAPGATTTPFVER